MLSGTAPCGKGKGGLAGASDALTAGADLGLYPCFCPCKHNICESEWSKSFATKQWEEAVKSLCLGKMLEGRRGWLSAQLLGLRIEVSVKCCLLSAGLLCF